MGKPRPLFHLFSSKINVKKCPSSIRCRYSNLQPLEHEFPPITTRPGLLPTFLCPSPSLYLPNFGLSVSIFIYFVCAFISLTHFLFIHLVQPLFAALLHFFFCPLKPNRCY